jgi:hypothetical protein
MKLKPWYKIEGLIPREDLREGKPLDAAEFAVNLEQIIKGTAPADYQEPQRFFDRTYLTGSLLDMSAQVLRRLSGINTETSAIFNLCTQFGGGKTHALTLLYHLAKNGSDANSWSGVNKILRQANIATVPEAHIAVFVGTEFDSTTGRGGQDGTPPRKTPWGEIAYQLGGEKSFNIVAEQDKNFIEPKGDVIRNFLPKDKPCLILLDEIINYVSTYRDIGYSDRLFNFIQSLSEVARSENNIVLVISIPASTIEYNSRDEADQQQFQKMLDRLGKAITISSESETSEIIRRRLFEWDSQAITPDGRIMLPKDAVTTCNEYAEWIIEQRQQLPKDVPSDINQAKEIFYSTYPFHPSVISVFERKWQSIPRFQRTRGILRLLALWVSLAYQDGFRGNNRDNLITLGTAPLDNQSFVDATLNQLGEERLKTVISTDICGKKDSHAIRLDNEAENEIKKTQLHRKVATTIFFESNGGSNRTEATLAEIRLALGEPDFNLANIETILETLASECYYLTIERTKYRFDLAPNLNKILADRQASVTSEKIKETVKAETRKIFSNKSSIYPIHLVFFPESPSDIPNQAILTLVIMSPEETRKDEYTIKTIEEMVKNAGASARTFKSSLIFAIANHDTASYNEARKLLAWQDIKEENLNLADNQKHQLNDNLEKAKKSLSEAIWRSYKYIGLLNKENEIQIIDLGLTTSNSANSITELIINRLRREDKITDNLSSRYLTRNWPPAFQEWSTKNLRDAFFASPLLPRLLQGEKIIKEAIAQGVKEGTIAYVAKTDNDKYDPFYYKYNLDLKKIEISEDVFIIKSEDAEIYQKKITDPPKLTKLIISPSQVQLKPGKNQRFTVQGKDQYEQDIDISEIQWETDGDGNITNDNTLICGEKSGDFKVIAQVGDIKAIAKYTIKPNISEETTSDDIDATQTELELPISHGIRWKGEIPAQKWMTLYTKIFTKFITDRSVKLKLNLEFTIEGDISTQKREEIKNSLQELGLPDEIDEI